MTYPGGLSTIRPAPTSRPGRLRGEVLRAKSSPSISELMARGALEGPAAEPTAYAISTSLQLGLNLAAWDPAAALPVLKTLTDRCGTVMECSDAQLGTTLAKLSLARAQAGDEGAFKEYAVWLPTTSPEQLGYSIEQCFEPLTQFPTNVFLEAAAKQMFVPANSAWSRLPWTRTSFYNPFSSGLVKVPAFRHLLARELNRKEVCGTVSWQASGISYSIKPLNLNGGGVYSFPEAAQTAIGTTNQLRWCDWITFSLSMGKHISPFNPFATVGKRDAAIADAKIQMLRP
jgi:hypothetical protein